MKKTLIIIVAVLLNWGSVTAQCLSQAGEISTTISSPEFCESIGGTLPVDIAYSTAPVTADLYVLMIVDDATQTIQTLQGFGPVNSSSTYWLLRTI